jgi:hypothetical protein
MGTAIESNVSSLYTQRSSNRSTDGPRSAFSKTPAEKSTNSDADAVSLDAQARQSRKSTNPEAPGDTRTEDESVLDPASIQEDSRPLSEADEAAELADLTRNQILQQPGTAMLAQASQLPQQILSLLR